MKNILRLMLLAFAVSTASCVQVSPLVLLGVFAVDPVTPPALPVCKVGDLLQGEANITFTALPTDNFLCMGVQNTMDNVVRTEVNGTTLDDPLNHNRVFVEEVLHSYSAQLISNGKTTSLTLPAETLRLGFPVESGGGKVGGFVQILGDTAAQALLDATQPGDVVQVLVTFRMRGRINSGGSITTQPFTFPVRFTRQ
ncbi:MAG: hypothetical protein K1X89_10815 [Myxococcaceae bacterium]|nr:hypothetical protein [Myxococcaceae bacterium]